MQGKSSRTEEPRLVIRPHQFRRLMADRGCNTATAQAEYLGVYISTITRVLAGDVQPSGAFVAIACSRLGVEIDDLFEVAPAATHRAAV